MQDCELRLIALDLARLDYVSAEITKMDPWKALGYSVSGMANYLSQPDPALNRREIDKSGSNIGVVCLRDRWLRGKFIELFCLFGDHRGKGIGSEILELLSDEVIQSGGNNLWTTVSDFNLDGQKFYKKFGFVARGLLPNLTGENHNEILMQKTL